MAIENLLTSMVAGECSYVFLPPYAVACLVEALRPAADRRPWAVFLSIGGVASSFPFPFPFPYSFPYSFPFPFQRPWLRLVPGLASYHVAYPCYREPWAWASAFRGAPWASWGRGDRA